MANLFTPAYPNAEWTSIQAGGVLAMFNGYERPYCYVPESKSVRRFGMLSPTSDCSAVAGTGGSLAAGVYVVTFVEAITYSRQGQGLLSGPPLDSQGQSVTVAENGTIVVTFPLGKINPDANEYWVYLTLPDGIWDTLGRVGTTSSASTTYTIDGATDPDFVNYPLYQYRDAAPSKNYPMKMRQRLLLWGSNEFRIDLQFTVGSTEVFVGNGNNELDHGIVGAVLYPDGETRGYLVTAFSTDSPNSLTLQDAFVGTDASQLTSTVSTKICHPSGELCWSEPSDYENFPAANVRYVELSAGDPETGCAVINGIGLLFTVRKTFGCAFSIRPDLGDGSITDLSTTIGCTSHRTIQDIGGMLVWLSLGGFAASTGGAPAIISDEIRSEFEDIIREPTGRVRNAFALNWPEKQRYICFVPDSGDTVGCSKAIVMDYSLMPGEPKYRFSIYKYEHEFVSGYIEIHTSTVGGTTNYPSYPVLGDKDGYTWTFGTGDADGPTSGTVSGTITSASSSPEVMTDTAATFDTDGLGLAGCKVTIVRASDGTEQTKLVGSNTSDTLYPDEEWDWLPSTGDTYSVGRIDSFYETGYSALGGDQGIKGLDRLISTHKVETGGSLTFEVYQDFSATPIATTNEGNTITLSTATGRNSTKLSTRRGYYTKLRWENKAPDQPWTLKNATLVFNSDESR
jgi:hypothetical protein